MKTLAVLAVAMTLRGAAEPENSEPFRFGCYASGSNGADKFEYWSKPGGVKDARSYVRKAFGDIKEIGFDYASFNHVDAGDMEWIAKEAEAAGLDYVYQGYDFPCYYMPGEIDGEFVGGSWMDFTGANASRGLDVREARRDRMRKEMLPWIEAFVAKQAKAMIAWTPVEEIPMDPMIDEDLAEIAEASRKADRGRGVWMIYHWLDPLKTSVAAMKPDVARFGPWGLSSDFDPGADGAGWTEAERSLDEAYEACAKAGTRLFVFVGGASMEGRIDDAWVHETAPPTEALIRAQVWLSIIAGAKGVEVFEYNSIDDGANDYPGANDKEHRMIGLVDMAGKETDHAKHFRTVIKEVKPHAELIGALARVESKRAYRVDFSPIRRREFVDAGGRRYLIVVNAAIDAEHKAEGVTLPPGGGAIIELD